MQDELDHILILVFANPFYEGVRSERKTRFVGCETVFRKAEIEEGGYGDRRGTELFLLLKVGC